MNVFMNEYLWMYFWYGVKGTFAKFSKAMIVIRTAQKMKFVIKNFFSKYDQICSFLWIWSQLLNKSLMKNFIFCAATPSFIHGILCHQDDI